MKDVSGYKHLEVENFSREEFTSVLHYYKENNWITKGMHAQVWGVVRSHDLYTCCTHRAL